MAELNRIALIANGELEHNVALLSKIHSYDYLIAVDGGLDHCHKLGLKPDIIIGDLDSASPKFLQTYQDIPQRKYPKDKDKTDLELAIEHALEKGAKSFTIFGGCGKRIDHTLANINLLSRYPGILFLETDKELLFVIDRQAVLKCRKGQTISLIPLNGPRAQRL